LNKFDGGGFPGIIPVKCGKNPISGFREDFVVKKMLMTHDDGQRSITIAYSEHKGNCQEL